MSNPHNPSDWAWLEALIVHLRPGDALGVTVHENSTVAIELACHEAVS